MKTANQAKKQGGQKSSERLFSAKAVLLSEGAEIEITDQLSSTKKPEELEAKPTSRKAGKHKHSTLF